MCQRIRLAKLVLIERANPQQQLEFTQVGEHHLGAIGCEVSVRCRAVSGEVDRACGLVFRFIDENNYYVTRANALEDNVNLSTIFRPSRSP